MTQNYQDFIASIWSQKINAGLDKTVAMLQVVNRDYQSDADKGVETIHIISPDCVDATPYTGSIPSYGTLSTTPTALVLDQKVCFGIVVPDIAEAQSNVSIIDCVTEQAKKGIESAIDAYLFSLYTSAAPENKLGTTASPIAINAANVYSKFVTLAKTLKVSGALNGANTGWVVVHPDIEEVLLLSPQFAAASQMGDKTIRQGAIGRIAGLDVFVSNNVGADGDDYTILAGTKEGITYASQLTKIETIRAQASFDSIVRGLYTFGGLVVNPKAIAVMNSELG